MIPSMEACGKEVYMGGGFCGGGSKAKVEADPQLLEISERLKKGQLTARDIEDLDGITLSVQRAANQLRASIIE
jgi:hypothetical protein